MRDEWINVSGKKSVIIEKLQEVGVSYQTSEKLLAFLTKEKNILCEDETYRMERDTPKTNGKMLGFMIMDYNYYINVRVGTVFLLSVLIDDKIGEPITAGYLTVRGLKQLVVKIDEDSGIKCILLELLRLPNKMGKEDILMDFKGECCNNNLKCHYRDENRCKCTNNDVKNIMERLVNIGILIKKDGLYHYDPLGTI